MLAVIESAQDLSGRLDLTGLLKTIVKRARHLMGSHLCWLTVYDTATGAFQVVVADGIPGRVRQSSLSEVADGRALSSHDLSLVGTYELGRALGRAPASVVVVSIDVVDTGYGTGLSPAVAAGLPAAVRAVAAILAGQAQESADQLP
jgi:hydrogenase maturation protease